MNRTTVCFLDQDKPQVSLLSQRIGDSLISHRNDVPERELAVSPSGIFVVVLGDPNRFKSCESITRLVADIRKLEMSAHSAAAETDPGPRKWAFCASVDDNKNTSEIRATQLNRRESDVNREITNIDVKHETHVATSAIRFSKSLALIEEKCDKKISINMLAECEAMSVGHFARVFRQQLGVPPSVYIRNVRLRKAKQLLRKGWRIKSVAFSVGFDDVAYFSRVFRQATGKSPGKFRAHVSRTV